MAIDMQPVREDKEARADALDRLAGRHIELNDGSGIGAVAAVGAAAVDGPNLAMRTALDARGRAPGTAGRRGPLVLRRAIGAGDGIISQGGDGKADKSQGDGEFQSECPSPFGLIPALF